MDTLYTPLSSPRPAPEAGAVFAGARVAVGRAGLAGARRAASVAASVGGGAAVIVGEARGTSAPTDRIGWIAVGDAAAKSSAIRA